MTAWLYQCVVWIYLAYLTVNINGTPTPDLRSTRKSRAPQKTDNTNNDSGAVIYRDPESESDAYGMSFIPKIPKNCKQQGICENVPDYPEMHVTRLLKELKRLNMTNFNVDVLDPQIKERIGPREETLDLCSSTETLYSPKAAIDLNDNWYYIVNTAGVLQQKFRVEICDKKEQQTINCSSVIFFSQGYEGRCIQKYILRKMIAIDYEGRPFEKALRVPSCCSCVYKVLDI